MVNEVINAEPKTHAKTYLKMRHEHKVPRVEPLVVECKVVDVAQHGACAKARSLVVLVQKLARVNQEGARVVLARNLPSENLAHGAHHDAQDIVVLHKYHFTCTNKSHLNL